MCHATGQRDESVEPQAPPFRTISRRVPLDHLEAQLTAGLLGGHPAMPKFTVEPREASAIMRYLRSIQEPYARQHFDPDQGIRASDPVNFRGPRSAHQ